MSLQRLLSRLAASALAAALGGCLSTPISSLPRLMRLDLATMEMGEVRAGLKLPDMLRVRAGDAVMTIRTRTAGGEVQEERFVLVEAGGAEELRALAAETRPGFALSVWRVAPEDLPRIAALQRRVRESRAQGPRIRGDLEIGVSGGCRTASVPPGPVAMSSFLKPARGEGYITLTDGLDLRRVIPEEVWQDKLQACGA